MIKKVLKIIAILLLLLVIAAFAIPYFFKDRIVAEVKKDVNNLVNAKVDFGDVDLSLFRSFPDFNFGLDQLSVTGVDAFEGYRLIEADRIELSLDLMSVISTEKPVEINSISLQEPVINIKILRDGTANYDIVKPSDPSTSTEEEELRFLIDLQKYEIVDGKIVYDDRLGRSYLEIGDLDHSGSGAFADDIFDLKTTTDISGLTARSGGVTYLNDAQGDVDLTLNADIPNSKFTIKDNSIALNTLKLNTEGYVQMQDDKINIDIKYDAPDNNFKNLLSMIPSAFTADYKDVQANGDLQLDGYVKGSYNTVNGSLPAFLMNLNVKNGNFKYPDLPLGIKDINTTAKINSPSNDLDEMIVDISDFRMLLGNDPFSAKAKLWTLISDPNVDTEIKGKIDLAELAKAFPMEEVSQLNGLITTNLNAKTSMSAIDKQDYENIDMTGDLVVENLNYKAAESPDITVTSMQMDFSPKYVKLENFDAKMGRSDVQAEGTIDNILAYLSPQNTMTGTVKIRSELFDANEWLPTETETADPQTQPKTNEPVEVFDRFDFRVDGEVQKILYDIYELRDSRLVGQVTPNKATVSILQTNIGDSDFMMDGTFSNVFDYLLDDEVLQGNINLRSNYINANEFIEEEKEAVPVEAMEALPVPPNMVISIDTEIKEVLYTNIPLRNIKGTIVVEDEVATIKNGKAQTLGGKVTMNGSYNTQNIEEPKFDMDYAVKNVSYQEAFDKLNTFATLAPIGKFVDGKFNTNFKMSGDLGKDMLPLVNTLSASGILETLDGTLRGFQPLEKFADKLNLKTLSDVNVKNTKNWFEIENGTMKIREFDYTTKGIDMVIGGSHSIENDMEYHITAKIPRKLLQENAVGQAADKGLNYLQGQASRLGINIAQGEFINVDALITGSMTNPKIKLNLLGTDGQMPTVGDVVEQIKEEAIDKVSEAIEDKTGVDVTNIEEEVAEVKEDLSAKADAEIAALMQKTQSNIKIISAEAEKRASQTRLEAKKLSDKAKQEGYEQADALIEKAGSNPFKKKAAEIAANKLRKKTDEKAADIITKGDETANTITDNAKKQTDQLQKAADDQAAAIRKKYN